MSLALLAFVAAYGAGLVLALARAPIWGLYAYLLAFYAHPPSRWWGEMLPDLRWSLVAAGVTLLATFIHRADRPRRSWLASPIGILLSLYVALMWAQTPWVLDPEAQRKGLEYMTKYLIVVYLMHRVCSTEEDLKRVLLAHVAGCFYLGWISYGMDVSGRLDGVGGPGIDSANTLGMHVGTGLIIASMFILVYRGWERWVCILMAPFLVNCIILTQTRGSFLGLIAAGLAVWYLRPRVNTKLFYGFATLGAVLFLWLAQDYFWERMASVRAAVDNRTEMDTSAESRLALIGAQWRMAADYPLGTGFRGTAALSAQYLDERFLTRESHDDEGPAARSSHNTFMTALVEQGVLGAVLFIALWIAVGRALLRLRRLDAQGLSTELATLRAAIGGALVVVFVSGMFTDYLIAEVQFWCFAILICLVQLAERAAAAPVEAAERAPPAGAPNRWYPG